MCYYYPHTSCTLAITKIIFWWLLCSNLDDPLSKLVLSALGGHRLFLLLKLKPHHRFFNFFFYLFFCLHLFRVCKILYTRTYMRYFLLLFCLYIFLFLPLSLLLASLAMHSRYKFVNRLLFSSFIAFSLHDNKYIMLCRFMCEVTHWWLFFRWSLTRDFRVDFSARISQFVVFFKLSLFNIRKLAADSLVMILFFCTLTLHGNEKFSRRRK